MDNNKDKILLEGKNTGHERDYLNKSTSFPLDKSIQQVLNESTQEDFSLSSPKLTKIQSDSILHGRFSPLNQKHIDFNTPKIKQYNSTPKSAEKVSPLCLNDFISVTPVVKRKGKKGHSSNDSVKRITPTYLCNQRTDVFQKSSNCFNNFDIKEISLNHLNEDRHLLLEEKSKILSKRCSNENKFAVISRKLKFVNVEHELLAFKSCVTNETALNNIADVYITILNNSFVLNVTSELYFLVMLLTNKHFSIRENKQTEDLQTKYNILDDLSTCHNIRNITTSDLFVSIHNVIFFVVSVLESQINILKCLDKSTLILLSESDRIKNFSKKFSDQLRKFSKLKSDKVLDAADNLEQMNVHFNLDTDNRDNFPSEVSFHSFRKQRDLFYEIIRIWELNHLQTDWNFSVGLGGKIRSLLNLTSDPTNFVHLCRLFKEQLLRTCGKYHKVSK